MLQLGFTQVAATHNPDLVVVNTCCVTATASAKSRQFIRKMQRTWPNSLIIVCGCLPITLPDPPKGFGHKVHFIQDRQDVAAELKTLASSPTSTHINESTHVYQNGPIKTKFAHKIKPNRQTKETLPALTRFHGQTRAFIKVQDGCDGRCAYCIIPQTRPALTSRPLNEIAAEARALTKSGHKELVITGVFLGAYGQATVRRRNWVPSAGPNLSRLLSKIAQSVEINRIRISSLEPLDITPELLDVYAGHSNIMPHLHLSIQSGSDAVLGRMGRQYRLTDVRHAVHLAKSCLDRPALTTDIIVGFPGETQEDFENTVTLAREIGFLKIHVFPFSPRPGTAAAKMRSTLPGPLLRERYRILRRLSCELGKQYMAQFIGERANVLIESQENGFSGGLSERYFHVAVRSSHRPIAKNDIVAVMLEGPCKDGLIGSPLYE